MLARSEVMFPYCTLTCHKTEWHPFKQALQGMLLCVCACVCVCVSVCVAFGVLAYLAVERAMRASCVIEMSCVQERSLTERGAFSHAPTSPRQMSNSFPNEKWHSPNPFLLRLLRPPPPPSSVIPVSSPLLSSPTFCDSSLPICGLTVINDSAR